jgi:hypothetical protein
VLTEDIVKPLAEQIADAADRPGPDLAAPALLIARIEYPRLDPGPYLDRLDLMGDAAFHFVARDPGTTRRSRRASTRSIASCSASSASPATASSSTTRATAASTR